MEKWSYKEGDLILGDCLEVIRSLPNDSCSLVIGSPPYEKARDYLEGGENLKIARDTEEWVQWLVEVFKECVRVSKGLVALVVGHGTGNRQWTGAPALLCANLIRSGINLRSPCWYKRIGSPGAGGNDWVRPDLEWIVCASKCNELPWHNNTACGHPPKYGKGGAMSRRKKDGTRIEGRPIELRTFDLANPGNVIDCDIKEKWENSSIIDCGAVGGGHLGSQTAHLSEAPFPVKIPEFFIRSWCEPGGVVLDPFGGSGTTLEAAVKLGRKFIMIELRKSQIELMKRRIKEARCKVGFNLP